ncbi:DUF4232 domain-containing protein [Streptomyces chiangmaiensis]|uniref:DUF4232 domain-containing protein n=1 Tax=Streptomyces chiangmaiensis TaxID=766497 RepID=A0ABU7FA94_9ACTN|nr:DUF4232 domain-containing protein [Streptomyces chiangmaiensis]MED7820993.1 DUF4232 domain-containing protein [Streptomyces chiangmaiensis]
MKRTTRIGVTALSSMLLAGAMTGGLTVGAGSAAAAEAAAFRKAPPAPCTHSQLVANSAHRIGSVQVKVTVVNEGPEPCMLKGFPTVALAGLGSPQKNKPLGVMAQGTATPVQLAVGGRASTQLTFTPVLGEAGGYCASGVEPSVAPTIVVGVAGGWQQLAPDDGGDFALCGNTVRATAFGAAGS